MIIIYNKRLQTNHVEPLWNQCRTIVEPIVDLWNRRPISDKSVNHKVQDTDKM